MWQNEKYFILKILNRFGIDKMYSNTIRAIYYETTANIILSVESLESFL